MILCCCFTLLLPAWVLCYVLALPNVLWVIRIDISTGVEAHRAKWLLGLASKPACGLTKNPLSFTVLWI